MASRDTVELGIGVELIGLARGHTAWEAAEQELLADAREIPGVAVETRNVDSANTKGALQEIILAITGPSAVAGLVRVMRLWLARDRKRAITVRIRNAEMEVTEITANGENVSLDTLNRAMQAALEGSGSEKDNSS